MSIQRSALSASLAAVVATVGLMAADVAEARRDPYRGDYVQRQAVKRAYVAGAIQQHRREEWRREVEYQRERERRRETRAIVGAVVGAAVVGAVISNNRD